MSANSGAVAEECWRAAIPVQLRLDDGEVSSLEQPPVLYFLVPRQSYLHGLIPQALALLQHLLPPGELVPWFEHGRLPLKWGVPAGVLYDLVAAPGAELPWRLTLHFRGFPDRQLASYGGEAALRGAFFNSLKEAAHICRGSAQRVMEMAGGAQEDLWRQVQSASLARYRTILGPLQLAPAAGRLRGAAAVPLRLYIRRDAGGYLSSYNDIASTSRPVAAHRADSSPVTLRQALLPLLEELLEEAEGEEGSAPGTPSAALAGAAAAAADTAAAGVGAGATAGVQGGGEQGEGGAGGSQAAGNAAEPGSAAQGDQLSEEPSGGAAADAAGGGGEAPDPAPEAEDNAASQDVAQHGGTAAAGVEQESPVSAAAAAALECAAAAGGLLVGGTASPLDAPLAWLHAQLHAGDYFLYVVLHLAPGGPP